MATTLPCGAVRASQAPSAITAASVNPRDDLQSLRRQLIRSIEDDHDDTLRPDVGVGVTKAQQTAPSTRRRIAGSVGSGGSWAGRNGRDVFLDSRQFGLRVRHGLIQIIENIRPLSPGPLRRKQFPQVHAYPDLVPGRPTGCTARLNNPRADDARFVMVAYISDATAVERQMVRHLLQATEPPQFFLLACSRLRGSDRCRVCDLDYANRRDRSRERGVTNVKNMAHLLGPSTVTQTFRGVGCARVCVCQFSARSRHAGYRVANGSCLVDAVNARATWSPIWPARRTPVWPSRRGN